MYLTFSQNAEGRQRLQYDWYAKEKHIKQQEGDVPLTAHPKSLQAILKWIQASPKGPFEVNRPGHTIPLFQLTLHVSLELSGLLQNHYHYY